MRRLILALGLLACVSSAQAQTFTQRFNLQIPPLNSFNWGGITDSWAYSISSQAASQYVPNTFLSSNTFFASPQLFTGSSITLTGANGYIIGQSTIQTSGLMSAANLALSTAVPTDVLSVNGFGNFTQGIKDNTTPGTNGALLSFQTMCGGNYHNGIYTGGQPCSSGGASSGSGWTTNIPVVYVTTATNNVVIFSSLTVGGNAFSVGGSTFVVYGSSVGIGTKTPNNAFQVMGLIDFDTNTLNTFLGTQAGNLLFDTGVNNVAVGHQSFFSNTSGVNNVALGMQALRANTSGAANDAIGLQAMFSNTIGGNNVADGYQALYNNTTGSNNTAIGVSALTFAGVNNNNTGIGYQSGYKINAGGAFNTAIGAQAMMDSTNGSNNTAVGQYAMDQCNTRGDGLGGEGFANTAVGVSAGQGPCDTSYGTSSNTLVGYQAGLSLNNAQAPSTGLPPHGSGNTLIGWNAGVNLTEGSLPAGSPAESMNILIGYNVGSNLALGSNNLLIGNNILAPGSGTTDYMSIDDLIFGNTALSRVGINLGSGGTPQTTFDVNGNAQFGFGVSKSTFDGTGDLTLANNASLNLSGANGDIITKASDTASGFFGNGYGINGMIVAASSSPAAAINIASTSEVTITTVTATVRGGRPYLFQLTAYLLPTVGRTYTIRFREEGALVSQVYIADAASTANTLVSPFVMVPTGAAASGVRHFEVTVQSSSATGAQTANAIHAAFLEF